MTSKVIVFDLDDTLYKEIDFLKSAYREIATMLESQYGMVELYDEMIRYYQEGCNVFQEIIHAHRIPVEKETLIQIYREHLPDICLEEDTLQTLKELSENPSYTIGLITDGRAVSQMNKINALGLKSFIEEKNILISEVTGYEKPDEYSYRIIDERYKGSDFVYVGDNPQKDFLAPNRLGWNTVCLIDDGRNIHKQDFDLPNDYLPKRKINALLEVCFL